MPFQREACLTNGLIQLNRRRTTSRNVTCALCLFVCFGSQEPYKNVLTSVQPFCSHCVKSLQTEKSVSTVVGNKGPLRTGFERDLTSPNQGITLGHSSTVGLRRPWAFSISLKLLTLASARNCESATGPLALSWGCWGQKLNFRPSVVGFTSQASSLSQNSSHDL